MTIEIVLVGSSKAREGVTTTLYNSERYRNSGKFEFTKGYMSPGIFSYQDAGKEFTIREAFFGSWGQEEIVAAERAELMIYAFDATNNSSDGSIKAAINECKLNFTSSPDAFEYLVISGLEKLEDPAAKERLKKRMIELSCKENIDGVFFLDKNDTHEQDKLFEFIARELSEPNIVSRLLGAILFPLLAIPILLVYLNPLQAIFSSIAVSEWYRLDVAINSLKNIFLAPFKATYLALINPLQYGISYGWHKGLLISLVTPFKFLYNLLFESKYTFDRKHAIASLIITGLIVAAVLLTLGIAPTALASAGATLAALKAATFVASAIGLQGMSVGGLAAIARITVGLLGSVLYGVGYKICQAARETLYSFSNKEERQDIDINTDASSMEPLTVTSKTLPQAQPANYLRPDGSSPGYMLIKPTSVLGYTPLKHCFGIKRIPVRENSTLVPAGNSLALVAK